MKETRTLYITNLGLLDNLAKTQVLPYLVGLAKRGIHIYILSFEKKELLAKKEEVEKVRAALDGLGIGWRFLTYHNRWGNLIDLVAGSIEICRIVKEKKISLLHARASIPILMAWPVAKIYGLKIIYDRRGTMAGDFVDDVNVKNIFSLPIFSGMLEALDSLFMRRSDATIVLSNAAVAEAREKERIPKRGGIITSIPCCVDAERFKDAPRASTGPAIDLENRFALLYLGSLGTCYLLEAMARFYKALKKTVSSAFFLVVSHTDRVYIEGILAKEGLSRDADYRVIDLRPEEVAAVARKCACSIMFIKEVACKIGSSPTKFAESLAAGIPVVVNKGIGDTEEIIRRDNVGVVVDSLEERSYEEAALRLVRLIETDRDLRKRCEAAAEQYFSLPLGIDRYYAVYRKVMEGAK